MIPIAAIAGIVVVEVVALLRGVDGAILALSMATIAGIGGYKVKGATVTKLLKKVGLNGRPSR